MTTEDQSIEVLTPGRLTYWCERIDLPDGATSALQMIAAQVRNDIMLKSAFAAFHERSVLRGEWHREWTPLPIDPAVEARCGDNTSLFYLLAYLSALPYTWERYQSLGLGMDLFQKTLYDIGIHTQDYYDHNGRWGFGNFPWIWRHLAGELFRLGRLQYMLVPFGGGVRAFRYKGKSGGRGSLPSLLLLADPETPLRRDGYAWGAGRPRDSAVAAETSETWRPDFEESAIGWRGHPVSPEGWVYRSSVWLAASDWELALKPGDTVLDLHIPRDGPFATADCAASHALAEEFFARVVPERPARALFCHTWMFSPQLSRMLPDSSNIVRFQQEFYLYPAPGTVAFLWNFVFGAKHLDPLSAPRDTTLRRAVLDHLARDEEIFDLPGLLFHSSQEWGRERPAGLAAICGPS